MSSTNWWQHDSDASRQEADGPPPPPPSTSGLNTEWTWSTPNQDGSGLRTAPSRAGGAQGSSFQHDLPIRDPISALRAGVKNITDYQGRATRPEFWWLWLMMLVIHFGTAFTIEFLVLAEALTASAAGLAYLGVLLGTFTIMLPAAVRRIHDSNQAGIWAVVPLINVILLLMPSDPTTNRFGPPR